MMIEEQLIGYEVQEKTRDGWKRIQLKASDLNPTIAGTPELIKMMGLADHETAWAIAWAYKQTGHPFAEIRLISFEIQYDIRKCFMGEGYTIVLEIMEPAQ